MKPKFRVGDNVKIIGYGHLGFSVNEGVYDCMPEIVGKKGIVTEVKDWSNAYGVNNFYQYSIDGVSSKTAWFDEKQLSHSSIFKMSLKRIFKL